MPMSPKQQLSFAGLEALRHDEKTIFKSMKEAGCDKKSLFIYMIDRGYDKLKLLSLMIDEGYEEGACEFLSTNNDGSYRFPELVNDITHREYGLVAGAAYYGMKDLMNRLLATKVDGSYEFPCAIEYITLHSDQVFKDAAIQGGTEIVIRLLSKKSDGSYEFPEVVKNLAYCNNIALEGAALNGHELIVNRLLARRADGSYEFPDVIERLNVDYLPILKPAVTHGWHSTSYRIATAVWGEDSHHMLPCLNGFPDIIDSIIRGAKLISEEERITTASSREMQDTISISTEVSPAINYALENFKNNAEKENESRIFSSSILYGLRMCPVYYALPRWS